MITATSSLLFIFPHLQDSGSVAVFLSFISYRNDLCCNNSLSELDILPVPLHILTGKEWNTAIMFQTQRDKT